MISNEHPSEAALRATIADFIGVRSDTIAASADFAEDLGLDSIDRLDLLATVEKRHGLELSDDEISSIGCLDDLLKLVATTRDEHR